MEPEVGTAKIKPRDLPSRIADIYGVDPKDVIFKYVRKGTVRDKKTKKITKKGRPVGCVCAIRDEDKPEGFSLGWSSCNQASRYNEQASLYGYPRENWDREIAINDAVRRAVASRRSVHFGLGKPIVLRWTRPGLDEKEVIVIPKRVANELIRMQSRALEKFGSGDQDTSAPVA